MPWANWRPLPAPSEPHPTAPYVRLGQVIAQVVAQSMVAAREQTHHLDVDAQVKGREQYHERSEPTLIAAARPLLERMLESPAVHAVLEPVLGDMAAARGQIQGAMLGLALPYLIGEGLSPILAPFAQGLQNEAWGQLIGRGQTGLAVPLPPPALADMVVRGIIDQAEGATVATQTGTDPKDFTLLVDATGEPPAVQALLEAYRRGIIARDRLEHGVRQGRTKNEWIDVVEALRYQPLTPGEAVAAAVQGHLSMADAQQKWAEGGMLPDDFQAAYESAGRPPGPSELLQLLNRGEMTQADVVAAIRESDVKDKYIDSILALRKYLPPPRTVNTLFKEGAISHAQAAALLADYGVEPQDVAVYLAGASTQKVAKQKALAVTTIEALYHDHLQTRDQAAHLIEHLGYTAQDADFMLTVQDLKREQGYAERAISAVHTQFVGHHITEQAARQALVELGLDGAAIGHLVTIWHHELAAHVRVLTPAQVVAAVKYQLIDQKEALTMLQGLGYSDRDAALTLDIGLKSQAVPVPNH